MTLHGSSRRKEAPFEDSQTRVLFLGNSFTIGGTASVPTIFDQLAQAGGNGDPTVVMQAVGGVDYQYHATNAASLAAIASQPWDYVVLQNFSIEPTHFVDGTHSLANHYTYGGSLYDSIMANHATTRVILFETWSRAVGHAYITGTSGPQSFASTAEMQGELRTNYNGLADSLTMAHPANPPVGVAPIGDAWENAGGLRAPSDPLFTDLHGSDLYHGDDDGYYLAAATIYATIYNKSPEGLSTHPEVSSLNLGRNVSPTYLESVAWDTVQPVPEPSAGLCILLSAGFLAGRRHRRDRLNCADERD